MGDELDFDFDADTYVPIPRPKIDRQTLPDPLAYLERENLHIIKRDRNWVHISCPFSNSGDEKKPSLMVHVRSGGFKCTTCQKTNGDILGLHRHLNPRLGFCDAVAAIGARFHE